MEVIRDNDLPILASCGGNCACATCHVYVDAKSFSALEPRGEGEMELLSETSSFRPGSSRLSCQISYSENLNGMAVTLAPYE
jgi:2Fe-2S ferredoxin